MNRLLVAIFIAIITLPLAANLAGIDGADPANENREMAPFPQWTGTWQSAAEYPDALGRWFEDHFGLRSLLVRSYGEIRLFVLGVSPSTAVIAGREGWLYYADDGGKDDYTNEKPMPAIEVNIWREDLVRAQEWLRAQGIAYVFTIAPDKHVIYPEYVPTSIRRIQPVSRTDQIFEALAGTRVAAVDLRVSLQEAKARERVYFETDTHWNDRGAYVAYRQIIDAVRQQLPRTPPAWTRHDYDSVEEPGAGRDLAGMLGLRNTLRETDLRLIPKRPRRARVVDPPGEEPMAELGRLVTEIADPRLPRAVIFRDSFASRLVPFLSEHFSRAVYLWQNDLDADTVLEEHPDVVIQEIVGRHLYTFLASPELIPR
jgi:alginate O-acetyltransferase complex protein AlgJ